MQAAKEKSTANSRMRIIEVATDLFLEKGFSGTSMSAIAKACDMTKASLYYHFAGKEDLFIACVTHGYSAAQTALEQVVSAADLSAEEKLRTAIDALYDTTIVSPVGRMSPLIAEVSRAFPKVARSFHEGYIEPQSHLLWDIVEEGVRSGQFAQIDRKKFLHMAFGPMVTLSLSREMFATFDNLDEEFPVADLRDGHADVLVRMLRPTEP